MCRRKGPDQPGELGGSAASCQGKRPSHPAGRANDDEDLQSCDILVPTAFRVFRRIRKESSKLPPGRMELGEIAHKYLATRMAT